MTSRERTRDSSYLSRAYPAPSRSYGRSISFGKDSYLSPVTAPRKSSAESYTGGILKHTNNNNNNNNSHDQPVSILSRGGSGDVSGSGSRRQRHNTLTFGVSGEDLDRARSNIQKYTRRLSDDTRPAGLQTDRAVNKTSSRYSLPDVFDSLSTPSYYDSRLERQQMVENIMVGSAESGSGLVSSFSFQQSRGMIGGAASISAYKVGGETAHLSSSRQSSRQSSLLSSSLPSGQSQSPHSSSLQL